MMQVTTVVDVPESTEELWQLFNNKQLTVSTLEQLALAIEKAHEKQLESREIHYIQLLARAWALLQSPDYFPGDRMLPTNPTVEERIEYAVGLTQALAIDDATEQFQIALSLIVDGELEREKEGIDG